MFNSVVFVCSADGRVCVRACKASVSYWARQSCYSRSCDYLTIRWQCVRVNRVPKNHFNSKWTREFVSVRVCVLLEQADCALSCAERIVYFLSILRVIEGYCFCLNSRNRKIPHPCNLFIVCATVLDIYNLRWWFLLTWIFVYAIDSAVFSLGDWRPNDQVVLEGGRPQPKHTQILFEIVQQWATNLEMWIDGKQWQICSARIHIWFELKWWHLRYTISNSLAYSDIVSALSLLFLQFFFFNSLSISPCVCVFECERLCNTRKSTPLHFPRIP